MEEDSEIGRRDDDADGKRSAEKEDEGCSEPSGERQERGRVGMGLYRPARELPALASGPLSLPTDF